MDTKLSLLKQAAARDDWRKAIAIAARFPRLGEIRSAVLDAHTAYTNPRFMSQIGRCPETAIAAGRLALISAYRIEH